MDDIEITLKLTNNELSLHTSEGLNLLSTLGFLEYCKATLIESLNETDEPKEGKHDC